MIVKTDPAEFQDFLSDASNYKGYAESIYFPESEIELVELLKKLNSRKIKTTITGNGTGLTGARVPEGGVVISLEKFNRVLGVNGKEMYARVQPAVILKELQDYAESVKLFYPPDPTERNCYVGATVATNASGARTFKYGATRNFVLGLRIVLPDGEIITIERGNNFAEGSTARLNTENGREILFSLPAYKMPATKNTAGYFCAENMDLIDLFIGSEGTLGIITELKLKLIELPKNVLSCVAFFLNEEDSLNFIDEARSTTAENKLRDRSSHPVLNARALEFFDHNAIEFLRPDYPNIPENTQSAVWFEEDFNFNEDVVISSWIELLRKHNCDEESVWLALDKNEQDKFHEFRHAISWKVNEYISLRNLKKVGTDIAVPEKKFRLFYTWMKHQVTKANMKYVIYGHFGDCHPHLNMLPQDEDEYKRAKAIYSEICKEAVRLDGTISAEHGIGKLKRDYLFSMYGESVIKKMAELKLVFDPNRILNLGNIFAAEYLDGN
ncbi:MAG: FAD-binding oxidoreductase [Ignavibacteriae bacterium HGW-Ignavibacteriae-3]|nr:MAG: FAD-binding oxidoreductase [Ignavibacteriae bacterium HGW-Ignavibacteriae-3]